MGNKEILTGNEAVARGFYEAGGLVVCSYPGSPTVEILESMKKYPEIEAGWSTMKRVALEKSIGASMAGVRTIVSMKHVGINIAADPFMTFTESRTRGGFILLVGDDPGLNSSQNEQDSRFWGRYANVAVLEPSNPQEIKEFVKKGMEISEKYETPVIIKLNTTLCHGRGVVELAERVSVTSDGFMEDQARFCMLPPFANKQQYFMKDRIEKMSEIGIDGSINRYEKINNDGKENSETLIITSGVTYEYFREIGIKIDILKLGMVYPLPISEIKEISKKYKRIIVIEELMPFIEEMLKVEGISAKGKEFFPFTGELTDDILRLGLFEAGLISEKPLQKERSKDAPIRTPMLCAGCPHRPIFHILKKAKALTIGDIGCYSLAMLEPFEVAKTSISMGASLGMAQGVASAQRLIGKPKPIVAMIGDGTFFHSGMTGMVELMKTNDNITIVIMDNRATAMTGGQETPTTGEFLPSKERHVISIKTVLESFGIQDITVVDQFKYKETKEIIDGAMKRDGLSIIITTRPCALNFKIKEPNFVVDQNICISCRSCIGVNCPPISMKKYEGKEKENSYINPDMCVGCSVCSQVCPVGAIKRSSQENKEVSK